MSKLDWMYKSSNTVDPEEYLLGKAIDKNFEQQSSFNEIDKDILPTSIFANSTSEAQVDVFRKIKEDPLEQIKQKEIEMRKQLLKNPVKLRKLQNLLKAKEEKEKRKDNEKKKNESLDALLLKLMHKHGAKSLDDLLSDSQSDEDSTRKKKSKKKSESDFSSDSDVGVKRNRKDSSRKSSKSKRSDSSKSKRSRSSSSEDHSRRGKRRSKDRDDSNRRKRRKDGDKSKHRSSKSDSDDDSQDHRKKKKKRESSDDELISNLIAKYGVKMLMDVTKKNDTGRDKKSSKMQKTSNSNHKGSSLEEESIKRSDRSRAQSKSTGKVRRSSSSDSDEGSKRRSSKKKQERKKSHRGQDDRRRRSQSSSSSESDELSNVGNASSSKKRDIDYSSDEERKKASKRAYGLVLPKGIDPKRPSSKSRPTIEVKKQVEPVVKPQFKKSKPTKLTEKEKEARLNEMMANAQWRDKERSTRVKRYKEEEKKELEQTKKYDDGFMRNELSKAASKSVEERIKSNINNLQRSKFSMNEHFARRT